MTATAVEMSDVIEPPIFDDRYDAGKELAERLDQFGADAVVVGLVRGGVPVAFPIALLLRSRLEVTVARALPSPHDPAITIGAVAEDGRFLVNEPLIERLGLHMSDVPDLAKRVHRQIYEELRLYRGSRPPPRLTGRPVILVDDGATPEQQLLVAAYFIAMEKPSSLLVAVPVIAAPALREVQHVSTDTIALVIRHDATLPAAAFYRAWDDVTDDEILRLLREATTWQDTSTG